MRTIAVVALGVAHLATLSGHVYAANSVVVESKTVVAGSRDVEVGIYISNTPPVSVVHMPFVIRSVTGGAFIADTLGMSIGGRLTNTLYDPQAVQYFATPTDTLGYANCFWLRTAPDFVSPDAVFYFSARGLILHQYCLAPGTDGVPSMGDYISDDVPSLKLRFGVAEAAGVFEIDTTCVGPEGLRFAECYGTTVFTPQFVKGTITVVPCACDCQGDPDCDAQTTVADVARIAYEAFNNGPAGFQFSCLGQSHSDINCDCNVDVVDLVRMIDVAIRGGDPAAIACDACVHPCR